MRATVLQLIGLVGLPVGLALATVVPVVAGATVGVSGALVYIGAAMDKAQR